MENGQIEKKKRVFSAIKPTGNPTLGNYLGTMQYWGGMADEYDCLFSVADLHAITVANPRICARTESGCLLC